MTFAPARPTASTATLRRPGRGSPSPTLALALILSCQLMIILDASVIITALPKIHGALGFSSASLSWVQNAYTLAFGGLLLLGARAGDILGRRRVFIAGIALFALSSLAGGLAQSASWLLAARAVQGLAAAIAAPSTLALLTTQFREPRERTRAVALYSAVSGAGGSLGLVIGGMLTAWASWRWSLFINVPIGAAVVALAPRVLPETARRPGRFDLPGALTSTLGMTSLVYGIVRAGTAGWSDRLTVAPLLAGAVLLAGFVGIERRAGQPITPLRLFADRERTGAYISRALLVAGMFSMFFFVSQYLQGVRGYSALGAGLAFLPMTGLMFAMVQVAPRLIYRIGATPLLLGGLSTALAGMVWLSRISVSTQYFPQIALPLVLLGIGIGVAFVPLTSSGIARVAQQDAGAASGLVNVSQQVGGSLGLGVLVTVFTSASSSTLRHLPAGTNARQGASDALAHGTATATTGSAISLTLALAVAAVLIRPPRPAQDTGPLKARPVRTGARPSAQ